MTIRTNIQGGHREQGTRLTDFMGSLNREPWMARALCVQVDPELFFPEASKNAHRAKAVCRACPAITDCADYALDHPELDGVWGGRSREERQAARQQRSAVA